MLSLSSQCLPHTLRGLWYVRRSSILSGAAAGVRGRLPSRAVVSSPAQRGCRCVRQASFMRSSLLSCLAWQSVCVAVLRSVRRGRWYAWRSSDLRGMRGCLPSCPARLSVYAAGFLHAWRPSVLLGVAVSVRGRLPSCVAVFRSARCGYRLARRSSFLSGAAVGVRGRLPSCTEVFCPARRDHRYARRSSVLSGAAIGRRGSHPEGLPVCAAVFGRAVRGILGSP